MDEKTQSDPAQAEANSAPVDPSAPVASQDGAARLAKETFSKEYVAELRAESEAWQKKQQKALAELNKTKQETQQALAQAQQATRERIIRAEMKALALKAGLRDLDCLKLADLSSVTLKDDDTLEGAAEMLATLKEAKPYLFAEPAGNTSPAEQPPAPNPAGPENVARLPLEEYERSKNAYLRAALCKAV